MRCDHVHALFFHRLIQCISVVRSVTDQVLGLRFKLIEIEGFAEGSDQSDRTRLYKPPSQEPKYPFAIPLGGSRS